MGVYCLINVLLLAAAIIHPGWAGVWAIFLTSFFMSLMYPTIFALGLQGLGADSKVGGSLIVMAIIGGAILTPVMGIISDRQKSTDHLLTCVPLFGYCVHRSATRSCAGDVAHSSIPKTHTSKVPARHSLQRRL